MNSRTRRAFDLRPLVVAQCVVLLGFLCAGTGATAQERIVTIGDSWAWLVANGAPGSAVVAPGFGNALQQTLSAFHPGVTVANESFMGGTAAQHATLLSDITARINAHPQADIVWLSSGGNDMLLGLAGGGFYVNNPNNPAVYAAIQQNVQTVVNHILSVRPDIQVVIEGYDYLNIWDTIPGGSGDPIRLNLGVVRSATGNSLLDAYLNIQQNQAVNDGFKAAEAGKIAIANASRRVHHINNFGLNNSLLGYNGLLGSVPGQGFYPPELWPQLPTPLGVMNTTDPIHLNTAGYLNLTQRAESEFLDTALSAANLALSSSMLDFGRVLVGTSAGGQVTASNAGPDFTKVKNLNFPAASGAFAGASQNFSPLFQDPLLGSDTAAKSYQFAPAARGTFNQALTATSDSGNRGFALTGQGVAPVAQLGTVGGFGLVRIGTSTAAQVVVANAGDGNLSGQGSVSNLRGSAADLAGAFTSAGGEISLPDGASTALDVTFAPTAHGLATATLAIDFLNGNSSGTNAPQSFGVPLSGIGVGPAFTPSTSALDFGDVLGGTTGSRSLSVSNLSLDDDGGLASLTNLTLLSASITGTDAGAFSLSGFSPGSVLAKGGLLPLSLGFVAGGGLGHKSATLTFLTDQAAAPGVPGASFSIVLGGDVVATAPELIGVTAIDQHELLEFNAAGAVRVLADAGDGLFTPFATAYGPDGARYVSDVLASRIRKIDDAGVATVFAGPGAGIASPTGLVVGSDATVVVADYLGKRVVAIDSSGNAQVLADAADGISGPFDVALASAGSVLVADTGSSRVLRIDASGNVSVFADSGDGLLSPIGLAVDVSGNVFVSDVLRSTIFRFTPGGVGSVFANSADGLAGPVGLGFSDDGMLYAADYLGRKIWRFGATGYATLFASAADGISGSFDVAVRRAAVAPFAVPEPSAWLLAAMGAVGLSSWRKKVCIRRTAPSAPLAEGLRSY